MANSTQSRSPSLPVDVPDERIDITDPHAPAEGLQQPRRVLDSYRLRLRSALGKIREAHVLLVCMHDAISDKDKREGLAYAMEDFLKPGNILERSYEELSKFHPSPEEMCRKADELLKAYRSMKNDWTLVVVYVGSVMILLGIISLVCGKDHFLYAATINGVFVIANINRKDKDDAIEKKIKGVSRVREVASSCCFIENDQKEFSPAYKQLMVNVKRAIDQMSPAQDKEGEEAVMIVSRKHFRDIAKDASQMKQKMEEMKKEMEEAEKKVEEAINDTSFMDIDKELAESEILMNESKAPIVSKILGHMKRLMPF